MLNQVRTLLLNQPNTPSYSTSYPAEELVPPAYGPVLLPSPLAAAWSILFGNNPDRLFLNYRLRQYMTLIHSTELAQYVYAKDPRVTYWPIRDASLFDNYNPTITQTDGGAPYTLHLQLPTSGLFSMSTLYMSWQIKVTDASHVTIVQQTAPTSTVIQTYTSSGELSNVISLGNTPITFTFQTGGTPIWNVVAYARPLYGIPDVVNALASLALTQLNAIFGPTDPYFTFGQLWSGDQRLPYKLGGLLLSLAYQIDALRA